MPKVDICGKVQFANDNVPVGFVLDTARQRGQSRADVRDASNLFEAYADHLSKEPTRVDDDGQPFLPVLAIVTPVRQVLMDSIENIDRRRTRPGVIEIGPPRGYRDLLSHKVNIQTRTPLGHATRSIVCNI